MKKEFLDYLYNLKHKAQKEFDALIAKQHLPKDAKCKDCICPIKTELEAKRLHILDINNIIEKYIQLNEK